jgi:hypothetical protein
LFGLQCDHNCTFKFVAGVAFERDVFCLSGVAVCMELPGGIVTQSTGRITKEGMARAERKPPPKRRETMTCASVFAL